MGRRPAAKKQGRPEMAKRETKAEGNDAGARSAIEDVNVGRRIMRRTWRL